MKVLQPQLSKRVTVLVLEDNGQASRGEKRQQLLQAAWADYVSFVDDDDMLPSWHVKRVLHVLDSGDPPEVVGFRLRYFVDDEIRGYALHSYKCESMPNPSEFPEWHERHNRFPNHLNPIRREIALEVGFRAEMDSGEDGDYARRLARRTPRAREQFINADLYDYLVRTKRPGEVTYERRMEAAAQRRAAVGA